MNLELINSHRHTGPVSPEDPPVPASPGNSDFCVLSIPTLSAVLFYVGSGV